MTDEQILQAMKSMLEPIQERLDSLEKGHQEIKERVTKIEVTQENDTSKRLDLLMEAQQEAAAMHAILSWYRHIKQTRGGWQE